MFQLYVALAVLAVCVYYKWYCSYWRRTGNIDGPQPLPLFGNMFEQIVGRKHFGEIFEEIYREYPTASWIGIYELFNKPAIVVRDLELVKEVLVGNFQSYNKNLFEIDERIDPLLAANPFTQSGEQWKKTRSQVVPIFSASKIRTTLPVIENVAENFLDYVDRTRESNPDFEAKEICAKYTIDVVASCAFGIDAESFTNPNAEFRQMCFQIFNPSSIFPWIRAMLTIFAPKVASILRIPFVPKTVDQWFRKLVAEIIRQRKQGTKRQDMFQAMYDSLSQNGSIDVKSNEIVGHSVTFLTEGFETSSTLMSHLLFELASNQKIQDRVFNEISAVSKEYDGKLTDEAVQKLNYLERAMYETLRMHSAVFTLSKMCTKEIELPAQYPTDSKRVVIKPGMSAIIPVRAIHYDPEIYPDPTRFEPDRFLEENKQARHRYAFLGFGEGPRICLGMKFGLTQSKVGIAKLLSKYRVKLSSKQQLPLEFEKKAFLLTAKNGIWINFEERTH
ncbi:probable cytochrome P450 308a1 [Sabethes cyaneus]|uniref:probable cytochrome P450 308a1 n=1 Tax=Sabethes cyaneus TaxID=53552 RepID=UPI00237DE2B3|nr:probable cytochrome P450 308a1 [Sabethes cyaneus]